MASYVIFLTDNGKLVRSDHVYNDDSVMDVFDRIKDDYAPAFIFKDGRRVFPLDGNLPLDQAELEEYRHGQRVFN